MLKEVQSANITAMREAEKDYTGLIEASRFVRDTSADVVAIGSTIATGGAAVGLLGASSTLKGFGKYQDTGKVGASVLYGAGSMALGAFKIQGAKLTTGGEYALIITQGALESGTSLAAGDSFANAVTTGGLKIASAGSAHAFFSAKWVKTIFAKLPVPVNVWSKVKDDGVNKMFVNEANALVEKTANKLTEKGSKSLLKNAISSSAPPVAPSTTQTGYQDQVPIEDAVLLAFAIVNMNKGIGHGW